MIKPRSPTLQVDSLPAEPQEKLYVYIHSFFISFPQNSLFLCYSQAWVSAHLRLLGFYFKVSLSCFSLICRYLKPWMTYSALFYVVSFEKQLAGQFLHRSFAVCVRIVIFYSFIQDPTMRLPWWLSGKESACSAGDPGSIPGSGRSPEEGNVYWLQYSCLGIPWTEEPGRLQSTEFQRVGHN